MGGMGDVVSGRKGYPGGSCPTENQFGRSSGRSVGWDGQRKNWSGGLGAAGNAGWCGIPRGRKCVPCLFRFACEFVERRLWLRKKSHVVLSVAFPAVAL